jgi:hypothetical protein
MNRHALSLYRGYASSSYTHRPEDMSQASSPRFPLEAAVGGGGIAGGSAAPLLLVAVVTETLAARGGGMVGGLAAAPLLVVTETMVTTNITNTSSANDLKHRLCRLTLTVDFLAAPCSRHASSGSPAPAVIWHLRGGVLAASLTAICHRPIVFDRQRAGRRIK